MLNRLRDMVRPRSLTELGARREFLLNVTVLVLGGLAAINVLLSGVAVLVFGLPVFRVPLLAGAVMVGTCYIAYRLGRRGNVALGGYIPPLVIWGAATGLLMTGGWHTTIAAGYVLSVALATLLNGLTGGVVASAAGLIAYSVAGWRFFHTGISTPLFSDPQSLLGVNIIFLGTLLIATCALLYAFDRQVANSAARRLQETQSYADELEQVAQEREQLIAELQRTTREQERLLDTVRKISAPVLPLFGGLVVMPLVGQFDPDRAKLLLDDLLRGIQVYNADYVLLDVTGVPSMDSASAQSLLEAVQGARMLGSECKLVGVQPAVAQELVSLDIDLSEVASYSTLREGLADLLKVQV